MCGRDWSSVVCSSDLAAALRGAMLLDDEPDEAEFDFEGAHQLYRDLFGGVESALTETDHLIIVPPADLLRLPFHALVTSEPESDSGKRSEERRLGKECRSRWSPHH